MVRTIEYFGIPTLRNQIEPNEVSKKSCMRVGTEGSFTFSFEGHFVACLRFSPALLYHSGLMMFCPPIHSRHKNNEISLDRSECAEI
jgi:hypothetical protein